MSLFLILIYESEQSYAQATEDDYNQVMAGHEAFGEKHDKAYRAGNALEPTSTARSVRPDGSGGYAVTDGPFGETKEALGGYYLVEADDLDAAVEIAKDVPMRFGGVEVRPIMVFT
jgi:hypothetical protein